MTRSRPTPPNVEFSILFFTGSRNICERFFYTEQKQDFYYYLLKICLSYPQPQKPAYGYPVTRVPWVPAQQWWRVLMQQLSSTGDVVREVVLLCWNIQQALHLDFIFRLPRCSPVPAVLSRLETSVWLQ